MATSEDMSESNSPEDKKARSSFFSETPSVSASSLKDGVRLTTPVRLDGRTDDNDTNSDTLPVILPWMGYGTYRLGKEQATEATLQALKEGYRNIDTAFIYGGETTERCVGLAIQKALETKILPSREHLFVTTKHWRKYHGYEATDECLRLSLQRLQLSYVDLWLMHWPGPAWSTVNRRKDLVHEDPWHYATTSADQIVQVRAETWRAMEDAYRKGLFGPLE